MVRLKFNKIVRGVSLLEVVIAVGIIALVTPAIATLILGGLKGVTSNDQKLAAVQLAQEGLEATQSIRDQTWNNLTDGPHGLKNTSGYWEWNGTSETLGIFDRIVTITSIDSNRKEVTSRVTWAPNRSFITTTHLTNWRAIPTITWNQSTSADFAAGTLSDLRLISQGDGALMLQDDRTLGTFTSPRFGTGYSDPNYQTLNWVASGMPPGSLGFQIKTSNSEPGLGSAVWLGPDGTRYTYYTISGTPLVTQGGKQWIQYRVFFSTPDDDQSPILESVTISYAP